MYGTKWGRSDGASFSVGSKWLGFNYKYICFFVFFFTPKHSSSHFLFAIVNFLAKVSPTIALFDFGEQPAIVDEGDILTWK